jgi:putative metalloprotease
MNAHYGKQIISRYFSIIACLFALTLTACENTDLRLVTEAGMDAIKAATLTNKEILELAVQSVQYADGKNRKAPSENKHAVRLQRLVGAYLQDGGLRFNYAVYLSPGECFRHG